MPVDLRQYLTPPAAPAASSAPPGGPLDLRQFLPGNLPENQAVPAFIRKRTIAEERAGGTPAQVWAAATGAHKSLVDIALEQAGQGDLSAFGRGTLQVLAPRRYEEALAAAQARRAGTVSDVLRGQPEPQSTLSGSIGELAGQFAAFGVGAGQALAPVGASITARVAPRLLARLGPTVGTAVTGMARALGEGLTFGTMDVITQDYDRVLALAKRDPLGAAKYVGTKVGLTGAQFAAFSAVLEPLVNAIGTGLIARSTLRRIASSMRDNPEIFYPPGEPPPGGPGGPGGPDGGLGALLRASATQRAAAASENAVRGAIAAERARPVQPALPPGNRLGVPVNPVWPQPAEQPALMPGNRLGVPVKPRENTQAEINAHIEGTHLGPPGARPATAPPAAPSQPAVRPDETIMAGPSIRTNTVFDGIDALSDQAKKDLASQLGVKRATPDDAFKALLPPKEQHRPLASGETWRARALGHITDLEGKAAAGLVEHPVIKTLKEQALPTPPPEAAQPAYSREMYRGTGRTTREAGYAPGAPGPVFGEGLYYAPTEALAKQYGPTVERTTVELKNPLTIRTDNEWRQVFGRGSVNPTTDAMAQAHSEGARGDALMPRTREIAAERIRQLRARVQELGHDGVVIEMSRVGDEAKRLREVFGHDQVFVAEHPAITRMKQRQPGQGALIDTQPVAPDLTLTGGEAKAPPVTVGEQGTLIAPEPGATKAAPASAIGQLAVNESTIMGNVRPQFVTQFGPSYDLVVRREAAARWTLRARSSNMEGRVGTFTDPQKLLDRVDAIRAGRLSMEGLGITAKRGFTIPKDYRETNMGLTNAGEIQNIGGTKKVPASQRTRLSTSETKLNAEYAQHLANKGMTLDTPASDQILGYHEEQRKTLTQAIDDARTSIGKNVPENPKALEKWAGRVANRAYGNYLKAATASGLRGKLGTRYGEEPTPELIKQFLIEGETNLLAERVALAAAPGTAPAPVTSPQGHERIADIVKSIDSAFDVSVREGHLRTRKKGALGQYDKRQEVIRTKQALDIPTTAHELGHHLDAHLDIATWPHLDETTPLLQVDTSTYTKAQLVKERVAEYLRVWLTDPQMAAQVAPNFTNEFETRLAVGAPDIWASLGRLQDRIHTWQTQPAKQRILGRVRPLEPETASLSVRGLWDRFLTRFVDRLRPWDVAMEKITGGGPARQALGFLKDPYQRAGALRGSSGEPHAWARLGQTDATGRKVGPSYEEILKPALGQLDDLTAFRIAKHAEELHAQGVKTGFEPADIQAVIASTPPHLGAVAKQLVDYNNAIIDRLVRGGLVDPDTAALWQARHKWYVSFERVFDPTAAPEVTTGGQALTGINAPIKSIRGSTRELVHPIESDLKRTYGLLQMAQRNEVMRTWWDLGGSMQGQGKWIETRIPQPRVPVKVSLKQLDGAITAAGGDLSRANMDAFAEVWLPRGAGGVPKENIHSVWVDGQLRFMWMHPELSPIAKSFQSTSPEFVRKFIRPISSILRAGATLTTEFFARNVARDPLTQFVLSEKWFIPYVPTIKGLFEAVRKGELFTQFVAGGGPNAVLVGMDRNSLLRDIEQITAGDTTALQKLGYFVTHPLEALQTISETGELSTRLGEMGLHPRGTAEEVAKAVAAAKDVTINFSRFGDYGRTLNDVKAFWNANIQDLDKVRRTFLDRPGKTTAAAFLGLTVPSVMLYLQNRDDPEWRALPRWVKNFTWSVKIGQTRLFWPKPFLLGQTFGTIPERILEWIDTGDPEALNSLARNIFLRQAEELVPIPTAILPALELQANYSFFLNRPIVPLSEQRLSPKLQYGPYTGTVAKAIGQMIGVSPRQIEYLVQGQTGGLGRQVLELPENLGVVPQRPGFSSRPIEQRIPGVKAFVRPPFAVSADVDEFYRKLADAQSVVADAQKEGRLPKAAPGQRLRRALPKTPDVMEMRRLVGISNELADVRKQIDATLARPDMDPDHKNAAVTLLNRRMVVLARQGLRRSDINQPPRGLPALLGR